MCGVMTTAWHAGPWEETPTSRSASSHVLPLPTEQTRVKNLLEERARLEEQGLSGQRRAKGPSQPGSPGPGGGALGQGGAWGLCRAHDKLCTPPTRSDKVWYLTATLGSACGAAAWDSFSSPCGKEKPCQHGFATLLLSRCWAGCHDGHGGEGGQAPGGPAPAAGAGAAADGGARGGSPGAGAKGQGQGEAAGSKIPCCWNPAGLLYPRAMFYYF